MSCATRHGSLQWRLLPENPARKCANPTQRANRQHHRNPIKRSRSHRIAAIKGFAKRKGREVSSAEVCNARQGRQLTHFSGQLFPSVAISNRNITRPRARSFFSPLPFPNLKFLNLFAVAFVGAPACCARPF